MPHQDRKPPEESDIDVPYGSAVEEVWYDESDDVWYGADAHGEFRLDRGATEPKTSEELGYKPCNCIVKFTYDRYDEKRYCTGLAVSSKGTCKHHKNRAHEKFLNGGRNLMKTGAQAQSHKNVFKYMEPYQKVTANDIYKSLIELSAYDFDCDIYELEVSCTDSDIFEGDHMILEHPIPTQKKVKCKALWYAALDFMTMELMRKERFRTAFEQTNDPSVGTDKVTVGERWTVVASGEQGAVKDKEEHHLNLPLSRMQKDYKQELTFGGVEMEKETEGGDVSERDWHVEIVNETETTKQDELHPDEVSPLEEIDASDADE